MRRMGVFVLPAAIERHRTRQIAWFLLAKNLEHVDDRPPRPPEIESATAKLTGQQRQVELLQVVAGQVARGQQAEQGFGNFLKPRTIGDILVTNSVNGG